MCQNYHAKGKTVCSSNLVIREVIVEQVIKYIRTMLDCEEIIDGVIDRLALEETYNTAQLEKDLNVQRAELKKLLDRQRKQDDDYYSGKIKAERYDRLALKVILMKRKGGPAEDRKLGENRRFRWGLDFQVPGLHGQYFKFIPH